MPSSAVSDYYELGDYSLFCVTVDVAVFTIQRDAQQVLLIERSGEPFQPGEYLAHALSNGRLGATGFCRAAG